MSAARIATILAAIAALAMAATTDARADRLDREMDAWVQARMREARADCASKLEIAPLPASNIDFITRYGREKWIVYKDCVLGGLGLDPRHLPPPTR